MSKFRNLPKTLREYVWYMDYIRKTGYIENLNVIDEKENKIMFTVCFYGLPKESFFAGELELI